MDESNQDRGKVADEIARQVSMNQISRPPTPMIERADSTPMHIEITVPKNPEKPKKKEEKMSRIEMATTIAWARKDEIDQARVPRSPEYKLSTQNMNQKEKSDLMHEIVNSANRDQAEAADPSIVPVTNAQIEQQRMDQAEQIDGQVLDLEDMEFKADELNQFTSRGQQGQP